MEKKVSSTGMYETTYSGDVFVGKLYTPTKIGLTDQTKVALLEYLTESDDFHKLVCDITGVERKQVKASPELEKLKEEYSHMRESYEQEQVKNKDLIQRWKDEGAKRMRVQAALEDSHSHHNNVMNRIKDLLKEVGCSSVRDVVDELKAERANGKLLADENELCRRENDRLKQSYDNVCNKIKEIEKNRNNLSDNYDRLAEDYNCLNTRYNNQKEYIAKYIEENKRLTDKVEKLKGKLDKASKRYSELIKIISDRAIKSIQYKQSGVKSGLKKRRLKMRRLSISNKSLFFPEEGELFFAEVPNKGKDLRVKTLVSKDNDPCTNCVFRRGELGALCWKVTCFEEGVKYTFRRVHDGEI